MSAKIKIRGVKCTALPNKSEFSIKKFLRDWQDRLLDKIVDPYVLFKFLDSTFKTETINDEQNPSFKKEGEFELSGRALTSNDFIDITVYDEETLSPDILVGKTQIHLTPLKDSSIKDYDEPLFDSYGRPTQSRISFQIEYVPPGKITLEDAKASITVPSQMKAKHRYPNKESQFKVCIKIIEARHLVGSHINPRVRIRIGNKTAQSRTQYCTCKPMYNEVFWFHFKLKPDDFFEKRITFEVYDIKENSATGSSTCIGAFSSTLDTLLITSDHGIFRKWLLLTRSDDDVTDLASMEVGRQSESTAAGYLKVTATVVGPGDNTSRKLNDQGNPDEDDVQSNMIPTSSPCLEPITLIIRIYHAEDLPQMDITDFTSLLKRSHSDKIDAFAKVSFDGASNQTKVIKSYRPEFNQEIYFLHDFPSICDRLKIQIFDQDPIVNDCVGTSFIALTDISKPSVNGYLPTFGPAYVNFYGSLREYSFNSSKHKDMNVGDVEGMAYRGRLLIEVVTKVGNRIETPIQEFLLSNHPNIYQYKKRSKYKLSVTFISAAMLKLYDYPIEFEVSIGSYGYKLNENMEPQSSVTTPANTVSDGCQYQYIPWNEEKPCCIVESDWEDTDFRLQQVNYLKNVLAQFESAINTIKASPEDIKQSLFKASEDFQQSCKGFEDFDPKKYTPTRLDLKFFEYRKSELQQLCSEINKLNDEDSQTVTKVLDKISSFMRQTRKVFDDLCAEHQSSIPDVIISMIIGGKRKAYCRIPAGDILFSGKRFCSGRFCDKPNSYFMNFPKDGKKKNEVACCINIIPWFGKEVDWIKYKAMDKSYSTYAELYENKSLKTFRIKRSHFSDIEGKYELKMEDFRIPSGWQWAGQWQKVPNDNLLFDADFGRSKFQQDVFFNESRLPFQEWKGEEYSLTNFHGDYIGKGEPLPPDGWKWCDDNGGDDWLLNWHVNMNRDCDADGWEYSTSSSSSSWSSTSRYHHTCRRKHLTRWRELTVDPSEIIKRKREKLLENGCWEFAGMFGHKFHVEEKAFSSVKRRRWLHKMKPIQPEASPIFSFMKEDKPFQLMPRIFHNVQGYRWQLCVYIWQIYNCCSNRNTMNQPYIVAGFQNFWQKTRSLSMKNANISNPLWNETLVYDIQLFGPPDIYCKSPPDILAELWDINDVGVDCMVGRCCIKPLVLVKKDIPSSLKLIWHTMMKNGKRNGKLLAAAQLNRIEKGAESNIPPVAETYPFQLPDLIRPKTMEFFVKYLCYGIRNIKPYEKSKVRTPSVELVIGESKIDGIDITKDNFIEKDATKVKLVEPEYLPPTTLSVYDNRRYGQKVLVGKHVVSNEAIKALFEGSDIQPEYITADETDFQKEDHTSIEMIDQKKKDTDQLDWWSKYYASKKIPNKCEDYLKKHKSMKIFGEELEKEESFKRCNVFQKYLVTENEDLEDNDENIVGELKGILYLHKSHGSQKFDFPLDKFKPMKCTVYVYVIAGINLAPKDLNGKCDSYIKVACGKQKESRKEKRVCNNLNPLYGEVFKLQTTLPEVKDLKIRVKDYDRLNGNDLVGETTIDLEDRYLSKAGACVGLPKTFYSSGIFQWRNVHTTPSRILKECMDGGRFLSDTEFKLPKRKWEELNKNCIDQPEIGQVIKLSRYENADYILAPGESSRERERLALHILNDPRLKVDIVQEHIETRTLWNNLFPGEPQGKIEMFVEIFPSKYGTPPPPLKIEPRQPQEYVLRLIVWKTENIKLDEKEVFSGERMSDIYVKGWLKGEKKKQRTDVHYRSMDGEGLFNWRMVFPIQYIPQQKEMVINQKDHFWELDSRAECVRPILRLEVWDQDTFSPDDFLGVVELDLCNLDHPSMRVKDLKNNLKDKLIDKMNEVKEKNLFKAKHKRGWWKVTDRSGKLDQGAIELELEIVTANVAESRPAGKGRDEPNMNPKLDPPQRPKTSFLWFTNPWKSFKFIVWKNNKWKVLLLLLVSLCTFFILAWIYNMPNYLIKEFK